MEKFPLKTNQIKKPRRIHISSSSNEELEKENDAVPVNPKVDKAQKLLESIHQSCIEENLSSSPVFANESTEIINVDDI